MTYEYVCTACHHEWEESQSISAAPLTECPECHGSTAKRQISGGTGFVLKGGGWYSDLYSSTKPKSSSDGSSSGSSSSGGSSSESKTSSDGAKSDTSSSGSSGSTASAS